MDRADGSEKQRSRRRKGDSETDLRNRLRNSSRKGVGAGQSDDLDALAAALAAIPEAERATVVAHVAALAGMSPARRAALLTLTVKDQDAD